DGVALALELGDDGELVLGQQLGADLVHPDLASHGLRDAAVVPGEHDDLLHTVGVQSGDHLLRIGAELVGNRDHTDHSAVESDDHGGAAQPSKPVDLPGRATVIGDGFSCQQRQVADGDAATVEGGDDALDGRRVTVG